MFLGFLGRTLPDGSPSTDESPTGAFDAARRSMQTCLDDRDLASME